MHPDQAAIQSTRTKRDVHFAICDRVRSASASPRVAWKSSASEKSPIGVRAASNPDRTAAPFPRFGEFFQQTRGDLCRLQSFTGDFSRCIGGSVVYDDQFAFRRIGGEIIESEPQRLADAVLFVEDVG